MSSFDALVVRRSVGVGGSWILGFGTGEDICMPEEERADYNAICIASLRFLWMTRSLPLQPSALIQLRRDHGHTTQTTFPIIKLRETYALLVSPRCHFSIHL